MFRHICLFDECKKFLVYMEYCLLCVWVLGLEYFWSQLEKAFKDNESVFWRPVTGQLGLQFVFTWSEWYWHGSAQWHWWWEIICLHLRCWLAGLTKWIVLLQFRDGYIFTLIDSAVRRIHVFIITITLKKMLDLIHLTNRCHHIGSLFCSETNVSALNMLLVNWKTVSTSDQVVSVKLGVCFQLGEQVLHAWVFNLHTI